MSIPDCICTYKNPILYNNQHNPSVLLLFSPWGNNRDWQFQVKFKVIATAFSSDFYGFVIKNSGFEQQIDKFKEFILNKNGRK